MKLDKAVIKLDIGTQKMRLLIVFVCVAAVSASTLSSAAYRLKPHFCAAPPHAVRAEPRLRPPPLCHGPGERRGHVVMLLTLTLSCFSTAPLCGVCVCVCQCRGNELTAALSYGGIEFIYVSLPLTSSTSTSTSAPMFPVLLTRVCCT